MIRPFLAALALVLAAVSPAGAQTVERIVDFHSEIWVNADASLTVRETITVDAARQKIRRGIFRDFPTTYETTTGRRTTVGFALQGVTRNGRREPFRTERRANGVRIYIGDAGTLIARGRHTYQITYRTERQLGFFEGFDELFWNVTGNGWEFPIERARATVHLPAGARVIEHAGYTGPAGARRQDFTYTVQPGGTPAFESTRRLAPGEGLTIAVSWPPGFVARPSQQQQLMFFLGDNAVALIGAAGFAILLLYYFAVWLKVGRDPAKGPIVPLYAPPDGLSPAGARYVTQMNFDDKAFTAAVVSLAVKGFLTIKEGTGRSFTLERTGQSAALSKGEAAIVLKLFPGTTKSIELKQKNHETLQSAKAALQKSLRTEFEKIYFMRNRGYFIPGFGLSVLILFAMVIAAHEPETAGFAAAWLAGWTAFVYFLVRRVWRAWAAVLSGAGAHSWIEAIFMTAFTIPFIGGEVMGLGLYASVTSTAAAAMVVAMQILNALFYHLLKAPTRLGQRAIDAIEGFKEYLALAEKDLMNLLNPPERTPELFEKYLPYALALNVEQHWAEQFSGVLSRAASTPTAQHHAYTPRWYSGRNFERGFSDCAAALGSSFSGAMASASRAPGSSSGSGGGGSSGGGGGGGGGGGW